MKANKDPDGPLYSFERCAGDLLPSCPIARKRRQNRSGKSHSIQANVSSAELERYTGKSGVELGRYYTSKEYAALTNEKKNELRLYRIEKGTNGSNKNQGKAKRKDGGIKSPQLSKKQMKSVVASVYKQITEKEKEKGKEATDVVANVSTVTAITATDDKDSSSGSARISGLLKQNLSAKGKTA